jgi:hypothetical protein
VAFTREGGRRRGKDRGKTCAIVHGKKVTREIGWWICSPAANSPEFCLIKLNNWRVLQCSNILVTERLADGRCTDVKYFDHIIVEDSQGMVTLPRINGLHEQAINPPEDSIPGILLTKPPRWIAPIRHILKPW